MKNNMRDCKHIMFAYFSAAALFGSFAVTLFSAKILAQTASQGGAGGNLSCSLPAGQDVFGPDQQYVPVFNPATDKPTTFPLRYPLSVAPINPAVTIPPAMLDPVSQAVFGVNFSQLARITDPAMKTKWDHAAYVTEGTLVPELQAGLSGQETAQYDMLNNFIQQNNTTFLAANLNSRMLFFVKAGLSMGEYVLNEVKFGYYGGPGSSLYGRDNKADEATLKTLFGYLNWRYRINIPQYQFFFDWNRSIGFSNIGGAWTPQGYVFDWRRNGWTADGFPAWWSAGAANCAPSNSQQNQTISPPATTTVNTSAPQSPEEILNFQQSQNDALLQLLRQLQQASGQVGNANTQSGVTVNNPNTNNAAANNLSNPSFCHTFNANLSIDSSGDDVSALRAILIKEGFPAAATGDFDETLASYVSGFQKKYANDVLTSAGLKNGTGYVGSRTRAKLNALYGCASSGSGQSSSPLSPPSQPLSLSNLQKVLKQISDKYAQLLINQSVALGQRSGGQGAGGGTGAAGGNSGNGGNGGSQNAPATLSFSPNKQNYCVGDSVTWSVNSNPAGLNADLYRTHNGVQDIAGDKKFSVKTNYTSDPYAFNANDVGNWSLFYRVDTGNGSSVDTNTFTASVNSCSNVSAAQDQQCETLYGVACASLLRISDPYVRDRFDHFAGIGGVTTAEAHPGISTPFFETIGLSPGEHIFNLAHFHPESVRLSSAPQIADMSSLRAIFDGLNAGVSPGAEQYHFDWNSGFGFLCSGNVWGPNGFDTNWQRGGYTSAGLPTWWSGGWGGTSCLIPVR